MYNPGNCEENGNGGIVLKPNETLEHNKKAVVEDWHRGDGIILSQWASVITLDSQQVEELYQILKHNR